MYNGLPAISAFVHKPLVGYIKTVSIGYTWRVKNEGRRKRNVYFSIYTLLLLLSSCLVVSDSATPWTAARQASLPLIISQSLLKLMFIELMMPSNHLILCLPSLLLHSIFPSIRVFFNESVLHIRWPKYWSFSISPSNEHSGMISFGIDWFDLHAIQGILKSLLQHHNSKASLFRLSVFLMVQPSIKNWCLRLAPRMLVKLLRTGSNSWRPQILLAGVHTVKKVCFHILIFLKNIYLWCSFGASPVAQVVKNPPALQETWVRSRGWEDPLEKEVATHSSILAWRIP